MKVTGSRSVALLDSVRPNDWNPNKVSDHKYESIKLSMKRDGWLASQPLLIWETDNRKKKRMLIIDGEHRWRIANELGFQSGPMVFLNGITKEKAIELTIKLDNNRGTFDDKLLTQAIREVLPEIDDPALVLGFTQTEINRYLALPPIDLDGREDSGEPKKPSGLNTNLVSTNSVEKMVPVYLDESNHREFTEKVTAIMEEISAKTVSEAIMHVVEAYNV